MSKKILKERLEELMALNDYHQALLEGGVLPKWVTRKPVEELSKVFEDDYTEQRAVDQFTRHYIQQEYPDPANYPYYWTAYEQAKQILDDFNTYQNEAKELGEKVTKEDWLKFIELARDLSKDGYEITSRIQTPEIEHKRKLAGEGLPQNLFHALQGPRQDFPPHVRKVIADNHDAMIIDLEVCRKPINNVIHQFANLITLGTLHRNIYYDDIFHLYLIIYLDNGKTFKIEKNHVIEISEYKNGPCGIHVELLGKKFTLGQFMQNAVQQIGSKFFMYDLEDNNCQHFISDLLSSNGLMTSALANYILQDPRKILEDTPEISKTILRILTGVASRGDILLHGKSLGMGKKKKKGSKETEKIAQEKELASLLKPSEKSDIHKISRREKEEPKISYREKIRLKKIAESPNWTKDHLETEIAELTKHSKIPDQLNEIGHHLNKDVKDIFLPRYNLYFDQWDKINDLVHRYNKTPEKEIGLKIYQQSSENTELGRTLLEDLRGLIKATTKKGSALVKPKKKYKNKDVQSVVFFTKKGWTEPKAEKWIRDHHYTPIKGADRHLHGEIRYRLKDPAQFNTFRSYKLPDGVGINLVLGFND